MADFFLRSTTGNNANDGLSWATAKATLAGAFAAMAAGDRVFVSKDHVESTASALTLTSPGTAANPCRVLCVDDAGDPASPTTLAETAKVETTGNSAITHTGHVSLCYGVQFRSGVGATGSASQLMGKDANDHTLWVFKRCKHVLATTGGSVYIQGQTLAAAIHIDCEFEFNAAGQGFNSGRGTRLVRGGRVAAAGTVPTALVASAFTQTVTWLEFAGVDLSTITTALVNASPAAPRRVWFRNCKLGAGVALTTGAAIAGPGAMEVYIDNCDSGDTNYKSTHLKFAGQIDTEIDVVRVGGASDGTTPYSRRMTTLAGANFTCPLYSPWMHAWVDSTGAKTFAVECLLAGAGPLKNDEAWLEVEYLGTDGFPLALFADDAKADVLAAGVEQAASAAAWNNTPDPADKRRLEVTIDVREKGPVKARVAFAKPSATLYYDPALAVA